MNRIISISLAASLAWALASICLLHAQSAASPAAQRLADGSGYVSVIRLAHQADAKNNGRLLMVFEQDGMKGIPLYGSSDDGDHWTFQSDVTDQVHATDRQWQLRWQPNISEVPRASGKLAAGTLLLAANATGNDERGRVITEDLQLYASTDGGHSWRYLSSIIKGGGRPEDKDNKGVWEPDIHVLDDGRMVAYYSSEQHKAAGYNQLLAHKVSVDGGRHWSAETVDVAVPGGVQRPGMATVARLPDGRYAMTYENIDGPRNGQVFIKYSRDGLDWGDPADHGDPVMTASGVFPSACPVVRWFPLGGPEGVIVVSSERAGGGGDEGGHALYWNNAGGRGPWWQVAATVRKLTGNIHAGWTQALLLRRDGRLLHVTSSSRADAPEDVAANQILFASAKLRFNRYEAEDAALRSAVMISDDKLSNGAKARIAGGTDGRLRFEVHVPTAGTQTLRVRFADLGLPAQPGIKLNGAPLGSMHVVSDGAGWSVAEVPAPLLAGFNVIDITGGKHALDVDYLQVGDDSTSGNPP
jgi:hypothetical protein